MAHLKLSYQIRKEKHEVLYNGKQKSYRTYVIHIVRNIQKHFNGECDILGDFLEGEQIHIELSHKHTPRR